MRPGKVHVHKVTLENYVVPTKWYDVFALGDFIGGLFKGSKVPQVVVTGHAIDAADIANLQYRELKIGKKYKIETYEYDTLYSDDFKKEYPGVRKNLELIDTKYSELNRYKDYEIQVCAAGNYGCNK